MSEQRKTRNGIVSGVMILTVANIIVKLVGFAYKIPLMNILGELGMAYYNSAYSIYVWFYTISTAGLPLAVAKLIAEARASGHTARVRRILRITVLLFGVVGIVGTAVMIGMARPLTGIQNNPDAFASIVALAPTLFFVCLLSALRGYFQGHEKMLPTAVSEVIEALSKLGLGIVLALVAKDRGLSLPYQAAFAVLGVTIGSALATLYLFLSKKLFHPTPSVPDPSDGSVAEPTNRSLTGRLLNIAIPISLSSSVMSIASLIDTFVMIRALTGIGMEEEAARAIYGSYSTQCITMYNLPTVLVQPIAVGIVPFLSAMLEKKDKAGFGGIAASAMKMTSIISFPCALGMSVLAHPILQMIFHTNTETVAPMLSTLAIAVIFVGIVTVTNVILQTHNRQYMTLISIGVGAAVKLIAASVLTGINGEKVLGTLGTPASTVICYFVAALMNVIFVIRYTEIKLSFGKVYLRPFLAALSCAAVAYGVYRLGSRPSVSLTVLTFAAILAAVVVYLPAIFLFRAVEKEDLAILPKSGKIVALLQKCHLLRG